MKRRAFQIVVLLILGAIVNVAVAWGAGVLGVRTPLYLRNIRELSESELDWFTRLGGAVRLPGTKIIGGFQSGFGFDRLDIAGTFLQLQRHEPKPTFAEWWNSDWLRDHGGRLNQCSKGILVTGWPTRSLHGFHRNTESNEVITNSLWMFDDGDLTYWKNQIGLAPIWPGFALNTIFYAAILWVVFLVPGMVRRRIRRRRGLCPACAYPIGTSPVCTECGQTLRINQ